MITKEKILNLAQKKGTIKSNDFVSGFGVSRQYAAKLIAKLVEEKKLIKIGTTRSAFYTTEKYLMAHPGLSPSYYTKTFINKSLEEHKILDEIKTGFILLSKLPENIKSIFEYAFSEMLNNAIEHSLSDKIKITVNLDKNNLSFTIDDFGIGVFKSIMKKRGLKSELEAIQDLIKGKITTAPKLHSGEGIFFTSKAGDEFILDSYGYKYIVDNKIKDVFIKKAQGKKQGTKVFFQINIKNKYHLNDIFKEYTNLTGKNDYGFDKTVIRIKLYTIGGINISRSQARRVLSDLEKFNIIVMDYEKVPAVGQAFCDEIYRVFQNKQPEIKIKNINMNEAVKFMVERAINEAKKGNKK